MKKTVDILLPCYNEEKTIEKCIKDIEKIVSKDSNYEYQIVLCDNNSTDNSIKIAKKLKVKILTEKKKGYGATLLNGINNSKADYIVMLDSDTSYDEKDIPKFVKELENYDFVIGNRFKGTIEKNAMPLSHFIGVKFLTFYPNLFFHTPSHDYHCGLRAFRRKQIIKCNLNTPGFEFASEMIIKAKQNGLSMKEIPTNLFAVKADRKPHLKPIKDGLRHLHLINKLIPKRTKIISLLSIFLLLYLLLFCFTSNYQKDNGIPIIDIRLNKSIVLDDIHNNDKSIKYDNNKLTIDNTTLNTTIKGRGNFTWLLDKRPYQISFDEKTSLLDLPKSKKYVLLANDLDPSLLKNDFTYSVAKEMNLNYSQTGKYIDLYIDKKYLGNYYLIPKVNINSSYVDLKDENAILMELDNLYYESEEYFTSEYFKDNLTIKDQASNNEDGYLAFQNKYNLMEKNIKNKNYKWLKNNIDIDSFIKYYIISDFAENPDSLKSSLYFYMDGLEDQIHIGPIWDFDIGYGLLDKNTASNIHNRMEKNKSTILFMKLYEIEDFRKDISTYWRTTACNIYKEEIEKLDSKIDYLQESGEMNSMYWQNKHYNEYTDNFKDWVTQRYDFYNKKYGCDVS